MKIVQTRRLAFKTGVRRRVLQITIIDSLTSAARQSVPNTHKHFTNQSYSAYRTTKTLVKWPVGKLSRLNQEDRSVGGAFAVTRRLPVRKGKGVPNFDCRR
jgi:hypothetical protein